MDSVKIEAYEREMKGKKKIKLASNRTSSSYTRCPRKMRRSRRISQHIITFFSTTAVISTHPSESGGVADT
jgi:hypothetical protein